VNLVVYSRERGVGKMGVRFIGIGCVGIQDLVNWHLKTATKAAVFSSSLTVSPLYTQ
jgi:hypothetical protein